MKLWRALLLATLLALAVPFVSIAAERFAAADGNDLEGANDCLERAIPCTITQAIAKASDGDVIRVAPGVYKVTEPLEFKDEIKGKRLAIVAEDPDPEKTTIDGEGKIEVIIKIAGKEASGSLVQGFTIQGGTETAILIDQASSIQIKNNKIKLNRGGTGILIRGTTGVNIRKSDFNEIIDNMIIRTEEKSEDGIRLQESSNNTIAGNQISGHGRVGIFLLPGIAQQQQQQKEELKGLGSNDNRIENNVIEGNTVGIVIVSSSDNKLLGNVVTDNRIGGIGLFAQSPELLCLKEQNEGPCKGNELRNNTVSGNGQLGGILIRGVFEDTTLIGNVANNNAQAGIALQALQDGSIVGRFVNTVISGNSANGNCESGFLVQFAQGSSNNALVGNVANDNKVDPIGATLVMFIDDEKHTDNVETNEAFDAGEFVYRDKDGDDTVSIGDVRLSDVIKRNAITGEIELQAKAGSIVKDGDKDISDALVAFETNEKHVDPNGNEAYDPGEFIYKEITDNPNNPPDGVVGLGDERLFVGVCPVGAVAVSGIGISFEGSGAAISGNTVKGNGDAGIHLEGSDNVLSENTVEDNHTGISLSGDSNSNMLVSNLIRFNVETGISLETSTESTLRENTIRENHINNNGCHGIRLSNSRSNVVRDNTVIKNGLVCPNDSTQLGGVGILLTNRSFSSRFLRNIVQENRNGISLGIDAGDPNPQGNVADNEFWCNSIINNEKNGIQVIDESLTTVRNSFQRNNIQGNSSFGLRNFQQEVRVNATDNWWGSPDGPSTPERPTDGDKILGPAEYVPWLQNPVDLRSCF